MKTETKKIVTIERGDAFMGCMGSVFVALETKEVGPNRIIVGHYSRIDGRVERRFEAMTEDLMNSWSLIK